MGFRSLAMATNGLRLDELNEGSEYKVSKSKKTKVERHHAWKAVSYKDQPSIKTPNRLMKMGTSYARST